MRAPMTSPFRRTAAPPSSSPAGRAGSRWRSISPAAGASTSFAPPEGRHFYGHGFFSADGRLLYATENDWEGERGVLGIYDPGAGYARIGEIDTGGIEPHEAMLMSDGRTIAIANGGIATHPDFGRTKLNLATMAPSLVYLDAVERRHPRPRRACRRTSISFPSATWPRRPTGASGSAASTKAPTTDAVDLVGFHRLGGEANLIAAPPPTYAGMRHYVGAMAANRDGSRIAATSPVGGRMLVFDVATQDRGVEPRRRRCLRRRWRRWGFLLLRRSRPTVAGRDASQPGPRRRLGQSHPPDRLIADRPASGDATADRRVNSDAQPCRRILRRGMPGRGRHLRWERRHPDDDRTSHSSGAIMLVRWRRPRPGGRAHQDHCRLQSHRRIGGARRAEL